MGCYSGNLVAVFRSVHVQDADAVVKINSVVYLEHSGVKFRNFNYFLKISFQA